MPTLIVCPTGLLKQWHSEIMRHCTQEAGIKVLVYHETTRRKDPSYISTHDIVITSYALLAMEASGIEKAPTTVKQRTSTNQRITLKPKKLKAPRPDPSPPVKALSQVRWFRIVLDECQSVKNPSSKSSAACAAYDSVRRWCLSGTPVQNKPFELFSYYRFLRYKPFGSSKIMKELVGSAKDGNCDSRDLIHHSFAAISLRRTKGPSLILSTTISALLLSVSFALTFGWLSVQLYLGYQMRRSTT